MDHLKVNAHLFQIAEAFVVLRHARRAIGILLLVKRSSLGSGEAHEWYRPQVEVRLHEICRFWHGNVRVDIDGY